MLPKKNRKRKYKKFLRKNYKKRLEKAEEKLRRYRSRRAKRSPHRLVIDKISKNPVNKCRRIFEVVKMDRAPSLLPRTEKSAVRRLARKSKWNESYESLLKIKKALDEKAKQPGARVYDFRMFDLVLGNSKPTKAKKEKLLDATGMTEEDRGEVLETVMEVTGARQIVDDAMKARLSIP
ncbi:unnamed protein product [Cylicostephanus goldi]|uniref:Uncharacterized protein n=1 Tax=Cylicostephanus goldi TaxID=71465 RepID=A0A3P7NBY1_CYLGO|nr:unnamed protein product [Cylicostephanus goldi]